METLITEKTKNQPILNSPIKKNSPASLKSKQIIIRKDNRFAKGTIANPKGRPKGSKNKNNLDVREYLNYNKIPLIKKAVSLALAGNVVLLAKLLDKIMPTLTENTVTFETWLRETQKQIGEIERERKATGTYGI